MAQRDQALTTTGSCSVSSSLGAELGVGFRTGPHGDTGAHALPPSALETEFEVPPKASAMRGRGLLILALLASIGGLTYTTLNGRELDRQLQLARSNVRILTQSQDQMFRLFMARVEDTDELTPAQQEFLDAWVQYDEQFYEANAVDDELAFERAITGFRLGHAYILLGDLELGRGRLKESLDQLLRLIRQDPEMVSYRVEAVSVASSLAGVLGTLSEFEESVATYQTAISLFTTSSNPVSFDDDSNVAELYEEIAELRREQGQLPAALRSLGQAFAKRKTAWEFDRSDVERARCLVDNSLSRLEILHELSDPIAVRLAVEETTLLLSNLTSLYPEEPSFAEDLARIGQRDAQRPAESQHTP